MCCKACSWCGFCTGMYCCIICPVKLTVADEFWEKWVLKVCLVHQLFDEFVVNVVIILEKQRTERPNSRENKNSLKKAESWTTRCNRKSSSRWCWTGSSRISGWAGASSLLKSRRVLAMYNYLTLFCQFSVTILTNAQINSRLILPFHLFIVIIWIKAKSLWKLLPTLSKKLPQNQKKKGVGNLFESV